MEEIVYSLNLDLRKNTHQVLVMKEGDVNSRVIEAVITDNGKPYDLTNCAVNLKWKKPDGHVVYTDAEKIDYGTVKIVCSEQMLAVAGIIEAEFEIIDGSSVASTLKFTVSINETVIDGSVIESSDDFSALQSVVAHVGNDDVHIPSGGISGDTIIKNDSGHVIWGEITPVYTKAETLSELTSKEKLSVAFGKLAKAVVDYISHKADKIAHITAEERTAWNAKLGAEKIAANLTTDTDGMVLAAAMGKNLQEQISTLNSNMNNTCSLAAGESIAINFRNAYATGNIAILQIYHPIEGYRALYFVISGGGSGTIANQKAQIIPLLESSAFSIEHNSNCYNELIITNNYTSNVTVRVVLLSGIFSNFTIS